MSAQQQYLDQLDAMLAESAADPQGRGVVVTEDHLGRPMMYLSASIGQGKVCTHQKIGLDMSDAINPSHYKDGWSNGAEVIDIREHLTANLSDAVKYLARAGRKPGVDVLEDLHKALWYIHREIKRIENLS